MFAFQTMEFVVKQYGLNGTYQLIQPLRSIFTSLCCTGIWRKIQRNANIYQSCPLRLKTASIAQMRFYELYFVDQAVNQSRLINIPVRVLNFVRAGVQRNRVSLIAPL